MGIPIINAVYFLSLKGDVLLHRAYRDDGVVGGCAGSAAL